MRPAHRRRSRWLGPLIAVAALVVLPVGASAHPLGNFTVNHHVGLRVEPERILLDVVVDEAEIPAYQSRLAIDTDGDGAISDAEIASSRVEACVAMGDDLRLTADGMPLSPALTHAALSFPPGNAGLFTLRLVCGFEVALPAPLRADVPTTITLRDGSSPGRLGWREIVAHGSGATLAVVDGIARTTSPSQRLTAYPEDLVLDPPVDTAITARAVAGGPTAPPWTLPDAEPLSDPGSATRPASSAEVGADTGPEGAVPGGIDGPLPTIFSTADLSPFVLFLSLVTAAGLGAGHALTPGHGKTLMAAYLVGTRGTSLHAVGLGLSVSVSHTIGILVLAAIVLGAADLLPPEVVVRIAPVVAAISILAIGGWMLVQEVRRRSSAIRRDDDHGQPHVHDHGHDHDHGHGHQGSEGEHSHGGGRHSHTAPSGAILSWRGLFALGLAGGLIPSTSALLILLGSIAAGRPAVGMILVVAFGLGMAAVMGGIGVAIVLARDRVDRLPLGRGLDRVRGMAPLAAAVAVLGFGIYLTAQALAGPTTL